MRRVEHVQLRRREGAPNDLWRKPRAAHSEQDDVLEVLWQRLQLVDPLEHPRGLVEPPEPVALVGPGPDGRIVRPDPVDELDRLERAHERNSRTSRSNSSGCSM